MDSATKTSSLQPSTIAPDSRPEQADAIGTATATSDKKALETKMDRKPIRARQDDKFKIFSGTSNPALAKEICEFLGMPLGQCHHTQFSDGEIYVQIQENVRGSDVFIVQPTSDPVAHNDPAPADDRCPQTGLGAPHHGRHFILWICPPGPQG